MIDIFSYNSYGTHLLPLWLNALIFLLAGLAGWQLRVFGHTYIDFVRLVFTHSR